MNILFVHEVDWLSKVVFDMHTLAESLSLRGHTVYAVDYENTWKRNSFFDFGSLRTRSFRNVSRAFEGSSVTLIRSGFWKIQGLSRLSAAVTSHFVIRKILREKQIDAVVLYSVPTTGLQVLTAAKRAGIPVLFRSIDILNQLVAVKPLRPITRLLEKKVYRKSDLILSLTPGLTGYVKELGADEAIIRPLLMPVDMNIFHPGIPDDDVRKNWGFSEKDKIVLFMGTLFDFSGLDDLIPLFGTVTEKIPEAKLLIVGDGPQRQELEQCIEKHGLRDSVTITGFEPYTMMPLYINLADVCINTFRITGATRDIFPGKTVQFLACGKPFIATPLPGLKVVIPGEEQGIVYAEKPEDMISAILAVLESPERAHTLGRAGLDYVTKTHSFESIARQLEGYLTEAVEKKRSSQASKS
jgi:glycosyltransferase involved in cell wall biosynthesis